MRSLTISRPSLAEVLESRSMLTAFFQNTQISSLPMNSAVFGPTSLTAFGTDLLFQATSPRTGRQAIWTSDGSKRGTKPLPISLKGDQLLVGTCGSQIYFAVSNAQVQTSFKPQAGYLNPEPAELYVTNDLGKTSTDLGLMPAGIGLGESAAVGNDFFFSIAPVERQVGALWETDGTRSGTHIVKQVTPVGYETSFESYANYLLVDTNDTVTSLDVRSLQTQQIAESVRMPVVFGKYAYFEQNGALMRTDGTTGGTINLYAGAASDTTLPVINGLLAVGNQLYLSSASELYIFSGTLNIIVPVSPLPAISGLNDGVAYAGQAVFPVLDGTLSLWHSDGTSAGTGVALSSIGNGNLFATESCVYLATSDSTVFYGPGGEPEGDGFGAHGLPGQIYLLSNSQLYNDLVVQVENVSSTSTVAGSATKGTVQITLTNNSTVASAGLQTLALYFSSDPAGDNALLFKTVRLGFHLAAGSVQSVNVNFNHLPYLAAGSYYAFAQISGSGQVLAESASAAPVVLTPGATLSNLSVTVQPDKSLIVRFEIVATIPLTGTVSTAIAYSDATTPSTVLGSPKIKLLARPRHPQHVQVRVRNPAYYFVSIKSGGAFTAKVAGSFAQTSINT